MEEIHGVDVSWLHHSPKDHGAQKTPMTVGEINGASAHKITSDPTPKSNGSAPPKPNGTPHHQSPLHHQLHRHSIGHHPQERPETPSRSQSTSVHKNEKPSALTRKSSWVSTISSKFSSTSSSNAPGKSVEPSSPARAKTPPVEYLNPFNPSSPVATKESKRSPADQSASTPPSSPGKSGDGFLKSAMRRLSSSGGATGAKAASHGATCPRKTMNIDPYRDRCSMPELDQRKLRRVAFLVDVEIAGAAQYPNADEFPKSPPLPVPKESSLTKLERQSEDQKKRKDQQLKKSEGEALKHPNDLADEKANAGVVKATGEHVTPENPGAKPGIMSESPKEQRVKEPTRKREKKRRSESERKERKERKQREALANGKIPAEIYRDGLSSSNTSSGSSTPSGTSTPPKHQDRPTTDPLRIYRRCCQLRETPILKRIAEQVASPSACPAATPGVISCLDLTGYWLQLPDVITLGDYLAVVPVKKLIMENCGLGDEAVRVILAGLMAAKTPEQARYNRKLGKKHQQRSKHRDAVEKLCVVEKVSFKNNPKIGRDGWRHIALFVNMSRSLKAIDLSMIPFPRPQARSESVSPPHQHGHVSATFPPPGQEDMTLILQEAISTRLGRDHLEELVMGECSLTTDSVCRIVQAVASCSVKRLGLASNQLTRESFQQIFNYVKTGLCEGLDIGGNDLRDLIDDFAQCLDNKTPLYALSVAACNLVPSSLDKLFPALLKLPNFRFIDLSHNHDLFTIRPSAIHAIRKYLPRFPLLKRFHLLDTMMNPEHAVSLAEVLPECKVLAHLNILDNEPIKPLADAKTESAQEEACAMYASFMAAVRVSESIVRVDIDVPSPESSDIVKAMAKQVVAYSLRNLERLPLAETSDSTIAAMTPSHDTDTDTETYPNVLRSLIGNVEGFKDEGKPEPAPDEDYIVGGTGVAKALDICLNRAMDTRNNSLAAQHSPARSGATTPVLKDTEMVKGGRAKEMSKILLHGARQIKSRLQPALAKEARAGDNMNYQRLLFLDSTLAGMISRFEAEYPETRLPSTNIHPNPNDDSANIDLSTSPPTETSISTPSMLHHLPTPSLTADELASPTPLIRPSSHRSSSPSVYLASRQAQEEGRMHRFGQRLRREILRPQVEDRLHGTSGTEIEPLHIADLRSRLEHLEGPEIQEKVSRLGPEAILQAIGASAEELERLQRGEVEGTSLERKGEGAAPMDEEERRRYCEEVKRIREKALAIYRDELEKPGRGRMGRPVSKVTEEGGSGMEGGGSEGGGGSDRILGPDRAVGV